MGLVRPAACPAARPAPPPRGCGATSPSPPTTAPAEHAPAPNPRPPRCRRAEAGGQQNHEGQQGRRPGHRLGARHGPRPPRRLPGRPARAPAAGVRGPRLRRRPLLPPRLRREPAPPPPPPPSGAPAPPASNRRIRSCRRRRRRGGGRQRVVSLREAAPPPSWNSDPIPARLLFSRRAPLPPRLTSGVCLGGSRTRAERLWHRGGKVSPPAAPREGAAPTSRSGREAGF